MDADFAGGWHQADSSNSENVISRTGMVIMYANWPIYWHRSLQTEIALSTSEAEYISLTSALWEVLLLTMEEINTVFTLLIQKPKFVCQVTTSLVYKWLPGNVFPANQTHRIKISPLQIQCKIWTSGNNIHTNWRATEWYSYQATFE